MMIFYYYQIGNMVIIDIALVEVCTIWLFS